jgi:anti-anti-sigma regulatory factor
MTYIEVDKVGSQEVVYTPIGALNAEHAVALRQILQGALEVFSHVSMNMLQVTEMDGMCLRQLCSAHHKAALLEKHFIILGVRSDVVKRTVDTNSSGVCSDCAEGLQNCPWRTFFESMAL